MQLIQAARANISSLLEECKFPYKVAPFDEALYQDCIDEARRHGYPMDSNPSVRTFLREGVNYGAMPGMHLPRPYQIWIALYTSCAIYVDEVSSRFPEEMTHVYLFNEHFAAGESQGNGILDAFADITRRSSEVYLPAASHLIITATMNFVTANILELETKSMKISDAASEYPVYQRSLSGDAEAYALMVLPREIPVRDYIQALPEMTQFIQNTNDVLSFYKEEEEGETTNQISTLAARTNKSRLEAFGDLTGTTITLYKRIMEILEGSSEAREAFKSFATGYVWYHASTPRYRLKEVLY